MGDSDGNNYRKMREDTLNGILGNYQTQLTRYRNAISEKNNNEAETAITAINTQITALQTKNKDAQEAVDHMIKKMEQGAEGFNENKHKAKQLRKLLQERQEALGYNQQRLKEDIVNDRWIHYKIYFFQIVILGLIILLIFFLARLKKMNATGTAPPPPAV